MKITVEIIPENTKEDIQLPVRSTVADMLIKIKMKPDMFIVMKNNIPIPEDTILSDKEKLRIIRVASGG